MDITHNIKLIRESKKITQAEMSRILDLDPAAYFRMEKRGDKLTVEQLGRIAGALGVSVVELLTGGAQTGQSEERVKDLEKRVEELEDRVKDKQFKIDAMQREEAIFEQAVFFSLSMIQPNGHTIEEHIEIIKNNKWLIPLLTTLLYNSIKSKNYHWKNYWSKAIKKVIDSMDDLEPFSMQLKKKYKRNKDIIHDIDYKEEDYEDIFALMYFEPTDFDYKKDIDNKSDQTD